MTEFAQIIERVARGQDSYTRQLELRIDELESRLQQRGKRPSGVEGELTVERPRRRRAQQQVRMYRDSNSRLSGELSAADGWFEQTLLLVGTQKQAPRTVVGRALRAARWRLARRDVAAGLRAYRAKNSKRARRRLRRAVHRSPEHALAWLYLARIARDEENHQQSLADVAAALRARPGWAPAVWHAADVRVRLGFPNMARLRLEGYEPTAAEDVQHLLRLGKLALQLGAVGTAARLAEHLRSKDGGNAEVRSFLVAARQAAGNGADPKTLDVYASRGSRKS